MEFTQEQYFVGGIMILMLVVLPVVLIGYNIISPRIYKRRMVKEERERFEAERARIAALPKLDTSRMLAVPMTPAEIEESKCKGGTFGTRYIHMMVIDCDGRRYMCFMTEYNMRALWRSEFHQATYSPYLIEGADSHVVYGEKMEVYPYVFNKYPRDSHIWKKWAELHQEFHDFLASSSHHFESFKKYYDGFRPRKEPLTSVVAA
jgi:hypothetical protein